MCFRYQRWLRRARTEDFSHFARIKMVYQSGLFVCLHLYHWYAQITMQFLCWATWLTLWWEYLHSTMHSGHSSIYEFNLYIYKWSFRWRESLWFGQISLRISWRDNSIMLLIFGVSLLCLFLFFSTGYLEHSNFFGLNALRFHHPVKVTESSEDWSILGK